MCCYAYSNAHNVLNILYDFSTVESKCLNAIGDQGRISNKVQRSGIWSWKKSLELEFGLVPSLITSTLHLQLRTSTNKSYVTEKLDLSWMQRKGTAHLLI